MSLLNYFVSMVEKENTKMLFLGNQQLLNGFLMLTFINLTKRKSLFNAESHKRPFGGKYLSESFTPIAPYKLISSVVYHCLGTTSL